LFETKQPPSEIFRVGRKPDPWQPPDWSRANQDGTFGNRFDDPQGTYRVLYAATQELSCYLETLARFRPDFELLAELGEIEGEDDFFPIGEVPTEWCDGRLLGSASAEGDYADIYAAGWVAFLRRKLAGECLRLGVREIDAAVLQSASPRRISQLASLRVYERGLSGIYYRSRFGHNMENWALFEPFRVTPTAARPIAVDNAILSEALRILGLKFS
jgi:RES domain-containing protein